MSPRLLKDEKGISPSSKGGGGFQESKIYESTRDGEGSGPTRMFTVWPFFGRLAWLIYNIGCARRLVNGATGFYVLEARINGVFEAAMSVDGQKDAFVTATGRNHSHAVANLSETLSLRLKDQIQNPVVARRVGAVLSF
jgi:hypothetical protein